MAQQDWHPLHGARARLEGQFDLMTIKDKDGDPFDRAATYGLTVTANVPVTLYWSLTAYDRATHTLIRGMPWASRSSNTPGLQANSNGSVDLYFGPTPPDMSAWRAWRGDPVSPIEFSAWAIE